MFWQSIKINKELSPQKIAEAMGSVFGIDRKNIIITTRSWDSIIEINSNVLIICTILLRPGDFPLDIEIILDDTLDEMVIGEGFRMESKICKKLNARGLIGDLDDNPYHWILINEEGNCQRVMVDSDLLDQEEPAFKIVTFFEQFNCQG